MAQVVIQCPVTEGLIPTGMNVVATDEIRPHGNLVIACSDCGRDHEWGRRDAVVLPLGQQLGESPVVY